MLRAMQNQPLTLVADRRPWVRRLDLDPRRIAALTAVGYLSLSWIASTLNERNDLGSVTRPAAGLALAAALLVPTRQWIWVAVGITFGQSAFIFVNGAPIGVALAGSAAACIEAFVGAGVVRRLGNADGELIPVRNYLSFLIGGVVVGPLVAGVVGMFVLSAAGADVMNRMPHLLLSDMLGILIFAPLILAPAGRVRRSRTETVALYVSVVVGSVAVFFQDGGGWSATLPYVLLPLLAWAAFRFGSRATVNCGLIVYLAGNVAVATSSSPFNAVQGSTFEHSVALRVFVAVAVASGLFLAAITEDLVDIAAVQAELRRIALTDPLTGLPNRARLDELLLQLRGTDHTVLLCDVDRFKRINDGYGHAAGDRLLVTVARRMRRILPPDAHLARFGGDEFVVVLLTARPEEVDDLVRRIEDAVQRPVSIGDRVAVRPTVSIGVADTTDAHTPDLLRHADAALYEAKRAGRHQARRFDATLRTQVENEAFVEREVEQALESGALTCAFQPETHLGTGELYAVEALARWHHPERGVIAPDEFVPVMEELGLADSLLHAVLGQSVRWQSRWNSRHGVRPMVSVNLSPHQLCNTELVESIFRTVSTGGSSPAEICLEITEGAMIDERGEAALRELKALGFHLAIDDFGTGWASMGRLAAYPWDLLKIDRSFVSRLDSDRGNDDAIVISSVALAHSLGIKAVAEGVETRHQLDRLRELGCDIVQGFLLGRPMDGDQIGHRLGTRPAARPHPAPAAAVAASAPH